MGLTIEIQKKINETEKRKVTRPSEVYELKEVQEIKDAVQEHLLFIGLDRKNNIRNVSLIGIGASNQISFDSKYIVRNALITASDRVILVHNHPSNSVVPSNEDKHMTNVINKLLDAFNIQFLDHIIVTEEKYFSMESMNEINKSYKDDKTRIIDDVLLIEENKKLKEKIKILENKLQNYKKIEKEDEDEFE